MEVEITYTDINGVSRKITAKSPDEAMAELANIPGFAKKPIDDVAESFIEKSVQNQEVAH